MPDFEILNKLILRTPYFPYQHYKTKSIEEFIADPHFQAALFLASISLFRELSQKNFKWIDLSPKIQSSIKKYVNRMTYRTTPFGIFSSFSLVAWQSLITQVTITNRPFLLRLKPDFNDLLEIYEMMDIRQWKFNHYCANKSIYYTKEGIRFLHYENLSGNKRNFTIKNLLNDKSLFNLIRRCKRKLPSEEILNLMMCTFNLEQQAAVDLLKEMVALQILVPAFQPNITGTDFYDLFKLTIQEASCTSLLPKLYAWKILDEGNKEFFYSFSYNSIKAPLLSNPSATYYANLERSASGSPPLVHQENLQHALFALDKLSLLSDPPDLIDFKQNFLKKFEKQAVPLLIAMDPELGVSYNSLATFKKEDSLVNDLDIQNSSKSPAYLNWSKVHQLLLNKWQPAPDQSIILEDKDFVGINPVPAKTPPSLSVLFKIFNGQLQIDQAGGNSATALMGRFTTLSNSIHQHSKEIAEREAVQNPQIIFAEITCISNGHVDNINRRQIIREHEILICTGSTLPEQQQIQLSDLIINVENNEVLLWSAKLKKRIIPRLSSAYNFQRNEIAAFRFLCDLQYQGLQHSLTLDLTMLFLGLKFYPRVLYKNCILATACWIINPKDMHIDFKASTEKQFHQFRAFSLSVHLPSVFALTHHDQYLVFCSDVRDEITIFLQEIKTSDQIMLKEVFKETIYNGTVVNEDQETFCNQFIASIINTKSSYPENYKKPTIYRERHLQRSFVIGSEWLFFKIYCHPSNSNEILIEIAKAIKSLQRIKTVSQWFFVRFKDPNYHLRIRLNINKKQFGEIIMHLNSLFTKLQTNHKVIQFLTDTYQREIERYTPKLMPVVEQIFYKSSLLTILFLKRIFLNKKTTPVYLIALKVAYDMLTLLVPESHQRIYLLNSVKEALTMEFGNSKKLKVGLDKKNRVLRAEVNKVLADQTFYVTHRVNKHKNELFKELSTLKRLPVKIQGSLITDLIHMHINRIFNEHMREQELVVYSLLYQFEITKEKINLIKA